MILFIYHFLFEPLNLYISILISILVITNKIHREKKDTGGKVVTSGEQL